jgi:uncharacterized membrane protein YkvA (DUF1232 family)
MWQTVVGVLAGLTVLWVALVATLYVVARRESDPTTWREVVRLVPDVVRLLRRLSTDPDVPRGVRVRLVLLLGYLLVPLDLVPDVIPVVGYADDAVIVALALRSVVRAAGPEVLDRHWPGTPQGLAALKRLARVPD